MGTPEESTGFELDFLCVGKDSTRSGDAICCRYKRMDETYGVIVVDGGTKKSGEDLVTHIADHYQTDYVDHVINSHPDQDHASGLSVVLESLQVGTLWMHRPWEHSADIRQFFRDGRMTDDSLARRIGDALKAAKTLEEIALQRSIPIVEPFATVAVGPFTVLHPTKEAYLSLIPEFPTTPAPKLEEMSRRLQELVKLAKENIMTVAESWGIETLARKASTTATNESSVILYGELAEEGVVLTADAGVRGLAAAIDQAESLGIDIHQAECVQVPHHGSRNNVTPDILDRLLGAYSDDADRGFQTMPITIPNDGDRGFR